MNTGMAELKKDKASNFHMFIQLASLSPYTLFLDRPLVEVLAHKVNNLSSNLKISHSNVQAFFFVVVENLILKEIFFCPLSYPRKLGG